MMMRCPPSRAGNGKRFMTPKLILSNAAKLNSGAKPCCAMEPAIWEMPTGLDTLACSVPTTISRNPSTMATIIYPVF